MNMGISLELKKIREKYNNNYFKLKVEINKEIKLITYRGEKSFKLNIIESFYETKDLIILNVQNSMTIVLKKDSFLKGTTEEFLSFLKENLKGSKK